MRAALERRPRMKERLFSAEERAYCDKRSRPEVHYALRFAAKEAVLKALGTGFSGMRFTRRRGHAREQRPAGAAAVAAGPPSVPRSSASSRCTCRCRSRTRLRSLRPSRSPRVRGRARTSGPTPRRSLRPRSRRRGRCLTRSGREGADSE